MENSVIDRTGHFIKKGNFSVDRFEDTTEITAFADDIYGARLTRTEIEHALIFSNETIFGDVIFNPLYNIRQYRLKMAARVAPNWLGRYEAPGFVIDGNDILPNFVKLGEDIREMFDIELADNTVLRDHARHVIGFETRDYLDKLLLNETQQFEMYQGMIQQKGSGLVPCRPSCAPTKSLRAATSASSKSGRSALASSVPTSRTDDGDDGQAERHSL
jgi:hypothetical protein